MASITVTEVFERAVERLDSEQRLGFLAALAHELTIAARGAYPEAGVEPDRSREALRYSNEMVMVVVKQLLASLEVDGIGYPDRAFINVLAETGRAGDLEQALLYSTGRALEFV